MSPRPKHVPANARQTTICLTDAEHAAIAWIKAARRQRGDDRLTLNDILVDALWNFVEKVEGKTRVEISATVPHLPENQAFSANITEMPRSKNTR